eukprot:COSAG03_NODE_27791_length_251_cov_0.677632_1_plen_54_part_10
MSESNLGARIVEPLQWSPKPFTDCRLQSSANNEMLAARMTHRRSPETDRAGPDG